MGGSVGKVARSLLLEKRLIHCNVLAVDGHGDRWRMKCENRSVDVYAISCKSQGPYMPSYSCILQPLNLEVGGIHTVIGS